MSEQVKKVSTVELFNCKVSYLEELFSKHVFPWDILPEIKKLAEKLVKECPEGFSRLSSDVIIGKNVRIAPTAVISGPAVIGDDCEIRHGAYIRGSVITGKGCVIGNSSELKNCILLDDVQVPHYNYCGDSILGNKAHLGAGSILSNLKGDHTNVTVHADTEYETGLRKFGAIIADGADIGCSSVLNPGTIIGKNTTVYPMTSVRGVIPENSIVKDAKKIIKREERTKCAVSSATQA